MNRALQTYAKPTYKVSRPKQDNVVNLPTRNETMTFGEMSAEIDSRFYETLLSTKWSINNRKSLYSQALDLRDQMEFKIDAFFDDLEITSLLRKLSKEKVETIRREIISTYCSISENSFLYKILERKNTESNRRKIARSTSTITYNVYRIRKIVSTIALGAVVAATASAYAKGFIGISESPKIERKT